MKVIEKVIDHYFSLAINHNSYFCSIFERINKQEILILVLNCLRNK